MKRLVGLMLTGALIVGSLAGCGSTNNTTGNNTGDAQTEADAANEAKAESTSDFEKSELISVISREDGSGTRGAFIELFGVEQKDENDEKVDHTTDEAIISNSTEVVLTTVAGDDYAIGYSSLGSINDSVKTVNIDGAAATVENIKNETYKIARPFNIATNGTISDVAQDFINYIMSADGQSVIEDNGYIAVSEEGAFTSSNAEGKIVVAGSSSVTPVMEKLKEAYMAINTKADIEIQESDSTTGMTAAMDGTCDIGMASRELKDSETAGGLINEVIAMDGIAVVVNNNNPITDLTSEQVMNIFTGVVTTWDEVSE